MKKLIISSIFILFVCFIGSNANAQLTGYAPGSKPATSVTIQAAARTNINSSLPMTGAIPGQTRIVAAVSPAIPGLPMTGAMQGKNTVIVTTAPVTISAQQQTKAVNLELKKEIKQQQ